MALVSWSWVGTIVGLAFAFVGNPSLAKCAAFIVVPGLVAAVTSTTMHFTPESVQIMHLAGTISIVLVATCRSTHVRAWREPEMVVSFTRSIRPASRC